jgi:molybdopterin synthase sulfur carrier subunit
MSIRVLLPNAFEKHTAGAREHQSNAANLDQLLDDLAAQFPALATHLRDSDGKIRRFINVYVNEEDIRFLTDGDKSYHFQDGDEVLLIPSIAGGSVDAPPSYGCTGRSCACGSGTCRCDAANRACTSTCCCCADTAGWW